MAIHWIRLRFRVNHWFNLDLLCSLRGRRTHLLLSRSCSLFTKPSHLLGVSSHDGLMLVLSIIISVPFIRQIYALQVRPNRGLVELDNYSLE